MIGAVDIGGTKVAVGVVDETGTVLSKLEAPTGPGSDYADRLPEIVAMLRRAATDARAEITGIGIGSTGPVNPFTGQLLELDFLPGWRNRNPVQDLTSAFGVPVALENDADAGALGEAIWGAGKGKSRIVYVTVGTGIGGGIILEGILYRGADGSHPEIGHHVIDPSGPECSCGFRGCWESLASGPAMSAWFATHAVEKSDRQNLTAEQVCQLAVQNDELALRAVERQAYYLGLGVANLINIFAPDAVVLGGGVMQVAPLLWTTIRSTIRRGCRFVPVEKTALALAKLGHDANLAGAAQVWHYRFGRRAIASHSGY